MSLALPSSFLHLIENDDEYHNSNSQQKNGTTNDRHWKRNKIECRMLSMSTAIIIFSQTIYLQLQQQGEHQFLLRNRKISRSCGLAVIQGKSRHLHSCRSMSVSYLNGSLLGLDHYGCSCRKHVEPCYWCRCNQHGSLQD